MQLNHDAIYLLKSANNEHFLTLNDDEKNIISMYHEYLCLGNFEQIKKKYAIKLLSAQANPDDYEKVKSERNTEIRALWVRKTELAKLLIEKGFFTTVSKIHIDNIVDAYAAMRKPLAKQFFTNNLTYIERSVRPAQAFDILKLDEFHFICLDAGFYCLEQNKFVSANVTNTCE